MIPANHLLPMVPNMSGNYCIVAETSHNLGHTIVSWGKGGGGGGEIDQRKMLLRDKGSPTKYW